MLAKSVLLLAFSGVVIGLIRIWLEEVKSRANI